MLKRLLIFLIIVTFSSSSIAVAEQVKTVDDYFKNPPVNSSVVVFGPYEATVNQFFGMTGSGKLLSGRSFSLLPACKTKNETVCIESLESRKLGEKNWELGVLAKNQFPESGLLNHRQYAGEDKYWQYEPFRVSPDGIPFGGIAPIWEMQKNKFSEGGKYVTSFTIDVDASSGNLDERQISVLTTINGIASVSNFLDAWNGNGPTLYKLPDDVEFRLKVRLGKVLPNLSPWLKGRMNDVIVKQESSTLIISGTPAKVTLLASDYLTCDQLPKVDEIGNPSPCGDYSFMIRKYDSFNNAFQKDARYSVGALPYWEPRLKVVGELNAWTLRTPFSLSRPVDWNRFNGGKCKRNSEITVISSNATLDSDFPPIWNESSESLEYEVVSSHLDKSNNQNKGFYSLSMPKSVATCLWGTDILAAKLEVSITNNEKQSSNVVTSSLTSTSSNFNFNVSGFNYSRHTISIKPKTGVGVEIKDVTPLAEVIPPPQELVEGNVATKVGVSNITTIKCTKNKIAKQITGVKPKCPAGYKLSK